MIGVVLAGGSGSRLWPLSTPENPKHLMSVGQDKTLLQDAYGRARMFAEDIYVVTDKSHVELVRDQLSQAAEESRIIVEPRRKGTASAIALSLARLAEEHGEDALVGFIHADHHIPDRDEFVSAVRLAGDSAAKQDCIALIGTEPDYPATGFGYIEKGRALDEETFQVEAFKEKPDYSTAEKYLRDSRHLWNMGLFAGRISTFVSELEKHNPELHKTFTQLRKDSDRQEDIEDIFAGLSAQAIEPALIEKTERVVVVPGRFEWMDIGSYKDLHEVLPKSDEHANAIEGKAICIDTTDSIVIENTGKPVAVLGLDNVAVISTKRGLLVCHKDHSQRVKEAVEELGREHGA